MVSPAVYYDGLLAGGLREISNRVRAWGCQRTKGSPENEGAIKGLFVELFCGNGGRMAYGSAQ